MTARNDPYRNSRFLLEIDGISRARFNEVTIADGPLELIGYGEGNEGLTVREIPGLLKYLKLALQLWSHHQISL
jgi:hypothetical protein